MSKANQRSQKGSNKQQKNSSKGSPVMLQPLQKLPGETPDEFADRAVLLIEDSLQRSLLNMQQAQKR